MRRVLYRILKIAVGGRPWGEAVLAEFDQTSGSGEALRWTAGGLWVAARERPVAYGVALAAVLLAVTTSFSFSVWYVPSNAMTPTLAVTSHHLVDRIGYRVTGVDHGDIVALPIPDAPAHETLLRVIGLPGDHIECRDGKVLRGGTALDEPYLSFESQVVGTECAPVTVPDGAVYVLGDSRPVAQDSRHWGLISADDVTGRLVV
ncbi:signal peptidase I [Actinoplanes flavus]|uniref:Signal peptidase I n=1 Tax=Actinoplanes flavus TaxID=2820290 RepID=A0ABS3UQ11_9ACTN|nr:signal peptidase I [Actinoplanes flavus]MBO3740863.1 signal peptidase I [Actinoplanes flavus]